MALAQNRCAAGAEALEAMPHAMDEVRAAAESVAGSADALSARLNALESDVATRRDATTVGLSSLF